MADLSGTDIDRYHLIEPLGQGGMAIVYKAYDTRLEREVAVKIIRRNAFSPDVLERVLKRFDREAKSLAKLTHTNIVSIIDYGEFDGSPYLVMPYLVGGTLKSLLGRPLPWQQVVSLLLPIADALEYAHQKGIVHRDVKPGNILITEGGAPMLTDFGIARLLENEDSQTLTGTGVGVGTPEYMSPEQGMGREVDGRSDVYSLGVVFYELVTGRKPYTADTPMAVVLKQSTEPLPRPGQFVRDLPENVEKILFKALAKNADDRYQSMLEFINSLKKLDGNEVKNVVTEIQSEIPIQRENIGIEEKNTVDQMDKMVETVQEPPVIKDRQADDVSEDNLTSPHRSFGKLYGLTLFGILIVTILFVAFSEWFKPKQAVDIPKVNTPTQAQQENLAATQDFLSTQNAVIQATSTAEVINSEVANYQEMGVLVYGPKSGSIQHFDDGNVQSEYAYSDFRNFIITASFLNPYSTSKGSWDYGFRFVQEDEGLQYWIIIYSDKSYKILMREGSDQDTTLRVGDLPDLLINDEAQNKISWIVSEQQMYLLINDKLVTKLELPNKLVTGKLHIATGLSSGDEIEGETTDYIGWQIWDLDQTADPEINETPYASECKIDPSKITFGTNTIVFNDQYNYDELTTILVYENGWPSDRYSISDDWENGCTVGGSCEISLTDSTRLYCQGYWTSANHFPVTCVYDVTLKSGLCGDLYQYGYEHTFENHYK